MPATRKHTTYFCRSAILNGFAATVSRLGGQPGRYLQEQGLPLSALSQQDLLLPTRDVLALFSDTAMALDVEDLGLRLAQIRPFSTMGPISLAMREQTSVGAALGSLAENVHIQAQGISLRVIEEGNLVFLSPVIDAAVGGPRQQPVELMLAALCSLLRQFLGLQWKPHTVLFMHKAPEQSARHLEVFGSEPLFNCDRNALVLPRDVLSHPITNSDPVFAKQLDQFLSSMDQRTSGGATSNTRELIAQLLPQGLASVDAVAACMGITRRTLHRLLSREGTSYRELLQETRYQQLQDFQEAGNLQQQEIADRLGFLSSSAFSRWKRTTIS